MVLKVLGSTKCCSSSELAPAYPWHHILPDMAAQLVEFSLRLLISSGNRFAPADVPCQSEATPGELTN